MKNYIKLFIIIFTFFSSNIVSYGQTSDDLLRDPSSTLKKIDFKVIKTIKNKAKDNINTLRLPIDEEIIDPGDNPPPGEDPPPPVIIGEVGSTSGEFNVSLTGAANYTIPIAVPPGIKDIIPSIALSFSSQAANGLAGWGWNISGLSSITRIPTTKFHDGEIDGVDFDNKDRFTLDGQRLILKNGTYGSNNSEYQTENYSNVKIIAYGTSPFGASYGPAYFIVFYPNGTRAWYGNSGNSISQIEWAIYKWEDPQGNYIEYNYNQAMGLLSINRIKYGSRLGATAPNEIVFYYKTRSRKELSFIGGLSFSRNEILDRIEVLSNYQLFRKYQLIHNNTSLNYQLVSSITESNSQNLALSPITFTYETPTIDKIERLLPTTHTIYPGINYSTDIMSSGEFNGDGKMDFFVYNKNNKNKLNIFTDLFSDYSGFTHAYEVSLPQRFDEVFGSNILSWNGKILSQQGITTVTENIGTSSFSEVKFSTLALAAYGPVFQYEKTWNAPTFSSQYYCEEEYVINKIDKQYISGDFNGDGLTDVIAITKPYTVQNCYTRPCDGEVPVMQRKTEKGSTETSRESMVECCECSSYTYNNSQVYFIDLDRTKTTDFVNTAGYLQSSIKYNDKIVTADFNGDGKTDIFHFTEGKVFVYELNQNNNLVLLHSETNSFIKMNYPILLGDYNGDGKTDFAIPNNINDSNWRFHYSTGTSFIVNVTSVVNYQPTYSHSGTRIVNGITFYNPYYEFHYIAQDFNGDGKTDILRHEVVTHSYNNNVNEMIRNYSNVQKTSDFYPSFQFNTPYLQNNNGLKKFGIPIFLDVKYNINSYAYINGNNIFTYKFFKDHKKDVSLKRISNNGINTDIFYENMDNNPNSYSQVYTPDYDENYPNVNINIAPTFKLVSKIEESGDGITKTQEYEYKGAVSNVSGIGFLGFKTTKRTNWFGTGVSKLWNISVQNPQLRGAVSQQWVSTSNSDAPYSYINKTIYTYNTQLLPNKVFINFPTSVVADDMLQGITTTQSFTYDSYYNPTDIITSFTGGSKQITYTYSNNITASSELYHVGRPTKKVATSILGGLSFNTEEQYTYNNNLVTKVMRRGDNTPWISEDFQFDVFGNTTQKTLSGSGVTSRSEQFEYDFSGRFLTKSTDIEGLQTTFAYNSFTGTLISTTNPYGLTTTYEYDGWNRVTKETDYLNNSVLTSYALVNGGGFTISVNYTKGPSEVTTYNAFGWVTKSKALSLNNQWVQKSFEYDIIGRRIKESEPYFSYAAPSQWNQLFYDSYGRPSSQQLFNGKTINTTFNGLSVTIDDGIKTVTTTKDAAGNIVKVQDPGGIINYTYFANGSLKTAIYDNHTVSTTIDGWGRKIALNDPSAGNYTYSYNILGELLQETSPKGTTTYQYDSFGKVKTKTDSGDNTNLSLNYSYNASSKLLSSITGNDNVNQKTYTYTYEYDNYKRPVKVIEDNSAAYFEKQLAFDNYGGVVSETYFSKKKSNNVSSTVKIRNIYDNAGILYEIQNFDTGEKLWKLASENEKGNPLSIELGNGLIKSRQYDQFGFLTQINDYKPGTNNYVLKMDYSFNAQRGTLNSRNNHSFNWLENFGYDNLDRLTTISGAVTFTQNYDTRGRITDNTTIGQYNYNTANKYRLNDIALNTQGNTYYQTHSLQQIKYNSFKKPIEIFEEGKGRVSFEYSPMGNRSHSYYGGLQTDKLQRNFTKHYSGITNVEIEEDKANNSTKIITYIGGDAYSAPIAHIVRTGSNPLNNYHYIHRDYLGSILAITDAQGNIKEQRQFGAWGVVDKFVDSNGNTIFTHSSLISRGFTGHEHFFEVGLIHMNGRMYDAKLGRFLSPDNYIQDPYNTQSFNRFGYVWNNPLSHIDPDGEFLFIPFLIAAATGAAFSAAIYTVTSLISGNFSWSGLGSSVLGGALQGMGAFFGPVGVVVGGILSSSVTTAIQGGSLGEIGQSAFIGGISSIAGSEFSKFAAKNVGTTLNGLKLNTNSFISRTITGTISGTAAGYGSGLVTGAVLTGNLREAHKYGLKGAGEGAKYGSISAGAGAIMDARKGGYNWWSGQDSKSVTVVGEGMNRVKVEASKMPGAKILNDMPEFTGTEDQITSKMMTHNRKWILDQMRSGRPILDIGSDLYRPRPSIFYQMELNMMKNYLKLHPNAFQIIKQ